MAFLSTPGIERLYSGVTKSTPSAASISRLSRVTAAGGLGSRSWLNSGRSSIWQERVFRAFGFASFASAPASLRLREFAADAADDDGDLGHGGLLILWYRFVTSTT